MSFDSLLDELDQRVDNLAVLQQRSWANRVHSVDEDLHASTSVDASDYARKLLSSARRSIAEARKVPFDYRAFINFLSECRVPILDRDEFEWGPFLGSGYTMSVYQGNWRNASSPEVFALKQINVDFALSKASEAAHAENYRLKLASVTMELRLMSHELLRNHPSIVRLQGITWNQQNNALSEDAVTTPVLVVELAALRNGEPLTLESYIMGAINDRPDFKLKAKLLAEVASGLHALHSLGVVHGDVKPSNVLVFHSGRGFAAKISDFGFCIAGDDNMDQAMGGTAFWSPPECFPDAPAEIRPYQSLPTRDYYSFGLVTWFVLFDEIPFGGNERALASAKAAEFLKDEIDKRFLSRFRIVSTKHCDENESGANQPVREKMCREQEQWNEQRLSWVRCQENHQHILRFLMQWVLVRDPESRRSTFDLYLKLLTEDSWLNVAKASFEEDGRWDREWCEYGRPSSRLKAEAVDALSSVPPKSLYSIETNEKLLDWGKLRNYETYGDDYSSSEMIASRIPLELQREIFRITSHLVNSNQSGKTLQQQRLLASCYRTGFGVQQSTTHAIKWYQKAAFGGDPAAAQALLQLYGIEEAKETLGQDQYCQLVSQVLLAQFVPDMQRADKRQLMEERLVIFSKTLCHDPTIATLPLQRALETYLRTTTSSEDTLTESFCNNKVPGWFKLQKAIEEDDSAALREAFVDFPTSGNSREDSVNALLHYAVKTGRAGMVWALVNEFGADPKSKDSSGLTSLARALRLGKTTAVRVLLLSRQSPAIEGSLIASDAAAEGEGNLSEFLYRQFVDLSSTRNGEIAENDRLYRWSFFSLSAAMLNNNWSSFCTLLSIGIDPNTTTPKAVSTPTSFFSAVMLAATSFNPVMLAALLAFGASPSLRTPLPDARTAMHLACGDYKSISSGFDEDAPEFVRHWSLARTHFIDEDLPDLQRLTIHVLLESGADIEAQDFRGNTPLMYSLNNDMGLVAADFLLGRSPPANINAIDFIGNTALHQAVTDSLSDVVDFCHKHGADLECPNRMGETALAVAAKDGQLAMCERLLACGARIGARDENGQNCLNSVIRKSHKDVMQSLLQHLRDTSRESLTDILLDEDYRGWTCLHTCIQKCAEDSETYHPFFDSWVRQLSDADIDRQDGVGYSMLHVAVVYSDLCANTLLELGASPNLRDSIWGWSPLHLACHEGNMDMLNLLLAHGGDFYLKDNHTGWTPLVLLEQTTDAMRLDQGDDFSPESPLGSSDDDDNNREAAEEDTDQEEEMPQAGRLRVAVRRRLAKLKTSELFARETMMRIARPMKQNMFDQLVEDARLRVFPGSVEHENRGAMSEGIEVARNMRSCFITDHTGSCVSREFISPRRGKRLRQ